MDEARRWRTLRTRLREMTLLITERRLTENEKREYSRLRRYFDAWFKRMTR